MRKLPAKGELSAISGADPLNFTGILTPGPRIAGITANRIVLRDGVPVAAMEAGEIIPLETEINEPDRMVERTLRVGSMPVRLRPYYA